MSLPILGGKSIRWSCNFLVFFFFFNAWRGCRHRCARFQWFFNPCEWCVCFLCVRVVEVLLCCVVLCCVFVFVCALGFSFSFFFFSSSYFFFSFFCVFKFFLRGGGV